MRRKIGVRWGLSAFLENLLEKNLTGTFGYRDQCSTFPGKQVGITIF